MTYAAGQLIVPTDFNGFVYNNPNNVNSWWGAVPTGWGGPLPAEVSAGNQVTAEEWNNLVSAVQAGAGHTGTTISPMDLPQSGDLIAIFANLNADIGSIYANRGNAVAQGSANNTWSGTASVTASTGTSNQNWTITWTSTVTFGSSDQARYFFNAGGLVKLQMSKTSNGTVKDSYWNNLVGSVGSIYISGGINGTQNIAGTNYNGVTVIGGSGSYTISATAGWSYLLANGSTLIYQKTQTASPYTGDYITVTAVASGAVLTLTTVWYSPGLVSQADNSITGGTATGSPFSIFGTAPAVVATAIYPSNAYITNTWGAVSLADSVNVTTSPGPEPPYTALAPANNFYASTISIPGVPAGGTGPASDPGYILYNGTYYATSGAQMLTSYYASSVFSGSQFTSPRDMVFVNPNETTPPSTLATAYGINTNDIRSIAAPVSVQIVANINDVAYFGYFDVIIGATPSITDVTGATFNYSVGIYEIKHDRSYNLAGSYMLPVPPVGHIYILAMRDYNYSAPAYSGTDDIRWTIPN